MLEITAILFRKKTGQYLIEEQDDITMEKSRRYADRLTDTEKEWCRNMASYYNQTPWEIVWSA